MKKRRDEESKKKTKKKMQKKKTKKKIKKKNTHRRALSRYIAVSFEDLQLHYSKAFKFFNILTDVGKITSERVEAKRRSPSAEFFVFFFSNNISSFRNRQQHNETKLSDQQLASVHHLRLFTFPLNLFIL
ncbi:hypothetical protein LOK49_LG09G00198 [Camellia lanceoleosa]|uniref:Uncharacterized protein n=1 Tax=Camellia lanceoleosa TaxID=1840588 RepID=A0ACC0GKG6_9ERIC|nr:hypothetical protein LOK49_LG09G00198 [Camellia lanceoleosa]